MFSFSRPKLAVFLLIAGLAVGWGWDHIRTTEMLRRVTESERYFRQRLFEQLGDNAALNVGVVPLKEGPQPVPRSAP